MEASAAQIVTELLKQGPLGAILIMLAWYCFRLTKDKDELHRQRVEDAKATSAQILDLSGKWSQTLQSIATVLDTHKEILREIKEVLREAERNERDR